MFQTEQSLGRAAQRYASVDKEDFESHVSLSSCLTEANLVSSNRLSAKKKMSQDFSNAKDPKFSLMLAHMKTGSLAKLSGTVNDDLNRKVNNYMPEEKKVRAQFLPINPVL